jgi:hypothetical protein
MFLTKKPHSSIPIKGGIKKLLSIGLVLMLGMIPNILGVSIPFKNAIKRPPQAPDVKISNSEMISLKKLV